VLRNVKIFAIIIVERRIVMSFDITPPSKNLSNVQASAQTSDGGAGNTGYFQRNEEEDLGLRFAKDYPNDSFEKEKPEIDKESVSFVQVLLDLIDKFINLIKTLFKFKS